MAFKTIHVNRREGGRSQRRCALRGLVVPALVALLALAAPCLAQPKSAAPAPGARPALSPPALLADQLVLLARQSLGAGATPRPDQLTRAAILLGFALELAPADAELWRLQAELADLRGQPDAALDALKRYCDLQRDDDATQLALARRLIARHQTLEDRVAAIERMLADPSAEGVSPALLSRLASYAAQAASEYDDRATVAPMLRTALSLDPTNMPAARLAYERALADRADNLQIGMALIHLVQADPFNAQARARLAELLRATGLNPVAATPPPPHTVAAKLAQVIDRWPAVLVNPDPRRAPWVVLTIGVANEQPRYLEPIIATLTLRNATDLPLSLGEAGVVPAQVFVYLWPRREGDAVPTPAPLVVDLGRRLRLEPRQSLRVPVRLDRGDLGQLLADSPTSSITLAATAVLDPVPMPDGKLATGPLGGSDTVRSLERRGQPITPSSIDADLAHLGQNHGAETMLAIARLGHACRSLSAGADAQKARARAIADALGNRFPALDEQSQTWAARFAADVVVVADKAAQSNSAMVRITYLATHVKDPASPALQSALAHRDRRIADFADALRTALATPQ